MTSRSTLACHWAISCWLLARAVWDSCWIWVRADFIRASAATRLVELLRALFSDPLRLVLGAFVGGLTVRAQLLRVLPDRGQLGLGHAAPLLVRLLLLGASGGHLLGQVLACLRGPLTGVGEDRSASLRSSFARSVADSMIRRPASRRGS